MIQLRPFSKLDWLTFSGAEAFGPEQPPYIAELVVDGMATELILDASFLAVIMDGENDDSTFEMRVPFAKAALALVQMKPEMTKAELIKMGFAP